MTFTAFGTVQQNPVRRDLDPFFAFVENVEDLFGFTGAGPFEGSLRVEAYPQGTAPAGVNGGSSEPIAAINGFRTLRGRGHRIGSGGGGAARRPEEGRILSPGDRGRLFYRLCGLQQLLGGFRPAHSWPLPMGESNWACSTRCWRRGQRIAELITNIIPGAVGQNGGYVWAEGSQPLHFSSLFGSSNSTLLANVPPQPVPDGFLPDAGKPDFQIVPAAALVNLGGGVGLRN